MLVFGGTFDPVHNGHLIVARYVAEALGFAKVVLVPTGVPPHKSGTRADAKWRLEMLRAAVAGDDLFVVDDLEMRRQGQSYTFDTIMALRRQHGWDTGIFWVIGADMVEDLPKWRRVREVLDAARIIIAARPPWDQDMPRILDGLAGRLSAEHVAQLRKSVVATPLVDISSTDIRSRVRQGKSIKYLTPESVVSIIDAALLYKEREIPQKS